ncbi:MAG: purine-nucleoside phosphorylase [Bacillota bacterium]|nr:purine-nucleoside phosphorylase [Bacillota bacterium]
MSAPTPHNNAKPGDFAKVVLMPGDPMRAKWIAENFLTDVKCVNTVRGMLGFTGLSKDGVRISVMGSGMGNPSIGIYSYELFKEYGVETIIRIGTSGSYQPEIGLREIVIAQGACTDSNWGKQYNLPGTFSAIGSFPVLRAAVEEAEKKGIKTHVGNVVASDVFYDDDPNDWKKWAKMGVLAVEMESYALYCNAAKLHKQALTILTVSDSFVIEGILTPEERQEGLRNMIEVAIKTAERFA